MTDPNPPQATAPQPAGPDASAAGATELVVGPLTDFAVDSAKRVDVGGHRLAVVRFDDEVHVIGDRCSHADYSLAEGELDCDEKTLECWKHGSTFSVETGEPSSLPATRPVPVYRVDVIDGTIIVRVTEEDSR